METASAKSPLHNFPPTFFRWGSKNHQQRCRRSPFDFPPPLPPSYDSKPNRPLPEERDNGKASAVGVEAEGDGEGENKPWNLRPRRAAASSASASMAAVAAKAPSIEPAEIIPKSMRLRGLEAQGGGGGAGERREKRKLWIALSREEIEDDIYSLTGSKPSRRPRRRPKNVQKLLDNVFPGLWLVGLTPEAHRDLDVHPKR